MNAIPLLVDARDGRTAPVVSVVITVRNGARFISQSIESILQQSFESWECIVVDDGSEDQTVGILSSFTDQRIQVVASSKIGRAAALNLGCSIARGKYLAIQDADDWSDCERLQSQAGYLERYTEIGLIGSSFMEYNETLGIAKSFRAPCGDQTIRLLTSLYNPFCHSTVMIRRDTWQAVGGYNSQVRFGIDFDFILRVMTITKVDNLPGISVTHRRHIDQSYRAGLSNKIRSRAHAELGLKAVRVLRLPWFCYISATAYYAYARLFWPVRRLAPWENTVDWIRRRIGASPVPAIIARLARIGGPVTPECARATGSWPSKDESH